MIHLFLNENTNNIFIEKEIYNTNLYIGNTNFYLFYFDAATTLGNLKAFSYEYK